VKSCKYNEEAKNCTASAIEVNVDGGGVAARRHEETNCHTFLAKS
jgi:hypothetical protein